MHRGQSRRCVASGTPHLVVLSLFSALFVQFWGWLPLGAPVGALQRRHTLVLLVRTTAGTLTPQPRATRCTAQAPRRRWRHPPAHAAAHLSLARRCERASMTILSTSTHAAWTYLTSSYSVGDLKRDIDVDTTNPQEGSVHQFSSHPPRMARDLPTVVARYRQKLLSAVRY